MPCSPEGSAGTYIRLLLDSEPDLKVSGLVVRAVGAGNQFLEFALARLQPNASVLPCKSMLNIQGNGLVYSLCR